MQKLNLNPAFRQALVEWVLGRSLIFEVFGIDIISGPEMGKNG